MPSRDSEYYAYAILIIFNKVGRGRACIALLESKFHLRPIRTHLIQISFTIDYANILKKFILCYIYFLYKVQNKLNSKDVT